MRALGGKIPSVVVGVLASKTARTDADKKATVTNAEVGAAHEFGTSKLPRRSFLRVPISENLQKYLESSGAFDEQAMAAVVKSGSIGEWLKRVGTTAEQVVQEAFATGGFGQWKPSNMRKKKVQQTLIESTQLRNSITSEVR